MTIPQDLLRDYPALNDWAILSGYRGSIAHGMYTGNNPDSIDDKDVMSICVPPLDYYFGLKRFGSRGTQEIKRQEWDIVAYELHKFVGLLQQGNPNVLMLLWLKPEHYLKITEAGQLLIDNRHLFVGRHVYRAFTGYAHSQLHKMTHLAFEGYMGQKRKELVLKFGYDTKNAAHLLRLLRMGIEFLKDGRLYVFRHDAPQLLEVKRGEWTLEQVKEEASRLFAAAQDAYLESSLPPEPNLELINNLTVKVIRIALGLRWTVGLAENHLESAAGNRGD